MAKKVFADKVASKRGQDNAGIGHAEREQARRGFLGNGLSRTAMLFRIATMAGHRLTVPELNRIKDINPRQLERTYEAVVGGGRNDQGRRPVCPATDTEVRRAEKARKRQGYLKVALS
jgi:hypothetical protein